MPFEGAISRFGLPSTGAQPEQFFPPEDDAIARYRQYLNTGSDVMPVAPAPGDSPDLDEQDWAQISKTPDPSKTLKMIEQLRSQSDFTHGVREIGDLDWSNPTKARQDMAGVLGRRPALANKFGSQVYRMLGMPEPAAKGAKTPATTMTGDPSQFVREFYQLNPTDDDYWDKRNGLISKYPAALDDTRVQSRLNTADSTYHSTVRREDAAEAKSAPKPMNTTQTRLYTAAQDKLKSASRPLDSQKKAAYKAKYGREPATDAEWGEAYHLSADDKIEQAKRDMADLVETLGPGVRVPGGVSDEKRPAATAAAPSAAGSTIPPAVRSYFTPKQ